MQCANTHPRGLELQRERSGCDQGILSLTFGYPHQNMNEKSTDFKLF